MSSDLSSNYPHFRIQMVQGGGNNIYSFDQFELNPSNLMLYKDGVEISLPPKVIKTLAVLIESGGAIISKDDLINKIWEDSIVEEANLTQHLYLLRKTLGFRPDGKPYIETLRRRGYRFSGDVRVDSIPAPVPLKRVENLAAPSPDVEREGNVLRITNWKDKNDLTIPFKEDHPPTIEPSGRNFRTTNPIRVLTVVGLSFGLIFGIAIYYFRPPAASTPANGAIRTIAVLPFKPLAPDSRDETLEMGMADTLISKLSGSPQIIVRPLSAVRRFRSLETDELSAGRELGVDAVLDGSIQRWNEKIRVNVRLLYVRDGSAVWSGTFDENLTDIFSVQDAISGKVVSALGLRLTGFEQTQLAKHYTTSPLAYEYFLRGREHYFRITPTDATKAIEFFQKAIEIDPEYALAYAFLADTYRTQSIAGHAPAREVCPKAKVYVSKAMELDPDLPEAHIVSAWIGLFYDWDWTATENETKRALELAPNNSDAHRVYAHLLSVTARHDEAVHEGRLARELAPLTLITAALEGQFLFYAGRLEEAEDRLNKTLELDPSFWVARNALARVYLLQGRNEEAIATFMKARETAGGSNEPTGQLGYLLAKAGRRQEAQDLLNDLLAKRQKNFVPMYYVALIYNGLGQKEQTLASLERAFEQREAQLTFLKVDSRWDWFRNEPRFVAIAEKMNLQ